MPLLTRNSLTGVPSLACVTDFAMAVFFSCPRRTQHQDHITGWAQVSALFFERKGKSDSFINWNINTGGMRRTIIVTGFFGPLRYFNHCCTTACTSQVAARLALSAFINPDNCHPQMSPSLLVAAFEPANAATKLYNRQYLSRILDLQLSAPMARVHTLCFSCWEQSVAVAALLASPKFSVVWEKPFARVNHLQGFSTQRWHKHCC